jgi:heat shock protein HtpX
LIHALPSETVFEAKQRSRRATRWLFLVLLGIYIVFFNLIAFGFGAILWALFSRRSVWSLLSRGMDGSGFRGILAGATLLGVGVAWAHFIWVRRRPLDQILRGMNASWADRRDDYHAGFMNVVLEAEAATNVRPIRPVVIPTTGCNAFSVQDGQGRSAIGVTEGLLARLDRSELSAVVCHEAAHLLHEDAKLSTTASALFGVFGRIRSAMQTWLSAGRARHRSFGQAAVVQVLIWIVASMGQAFSRLVYMAISRKREFLADAAAVQMCKDPLSLAEALHKISNGYRGQVEVPDGFSSIFIVPPGFSRLDGGRHLVSVLFSTHPPMEDRLAKLLQWAKTDLRTFQQGLEQERKKAEGDAAPRGFYVHRGECWEGPLEPAQLVASGLTPGHWVCPAGENENRIGRASQLPELLSLLAGKSGSASTKWKCPRCKVPLSKADYEGAPVLRCAFCGGHLLRAGVLERLIARRDESFTPEEIERAGIWRAGRRGAIKKLCDFEWIRCPFCGHEMTKVIHSVLTQVVIDRCLAYSCHAVWCDSRELETIQILVERVGRGDS